MIASTTFRRISTIRPQLRALNTGVASTSTATHTLEVAPSSAAPQTDTTHFKITLRRSAISLGAAKQRTLISLGLTRRHQTVYHPHTPDIAGKILLLKELLEVENVSDHKGEVKTKQEQRQERKAPKGYVVSGSRLGKSVFE